MMSPTFAVVRSTCLVTARFAVGPPGTPGVVAGGEVGGITTPGGAVVPGAGGVVGGVIGGTRGIFGTTTPRLRDRTLVNVQVTRGRCALIRTSAIPCANGTSFPAHETLSSSQLPGAEEC